MPVGLITEIVKKTPDRRILKELKKVNRFFRVTVPYLEQDPYFSNLALLFARPQGKDNFNLLREPAESIILNLQENGHLALSSCSKLDFGNKKPSLSGAKMAYEYFAETEKSFPREYGVTILALAVKKSAFLMKVETLRGERQEEIFQFSLSPEDFFVIGICEVSTDLQIRMATNAALKNPPYFDLQTQTDINPGKNRLLEIFRSEANQLKKCVPPFDLKNDIFESEVNLGFVALAQECEPSEELASTEELDSQETLFVGCRF